MDAGSGLNLHVINLNPAKGSLFIAAPGGKFNPLAPTTPNGSETVTFTGGLTSSISYIGFNIVKHQ